MLSHESLHRFGRKLALDYRFCQNTGIEDIDVAICLSKLGAYSEPSTDDKGRERFHPMDIRSTYELRENVLWLFHYAKNQPKKVHIYINI